MNFKPTIITLCSLMATGYASAHHSFAPYDIRNPIEITGVTEDFVYRRPHPMLTFLDDENVEWEIEVPLRFWNRAGIAQDAIKSGDEPIVLGWPAVTVALQATSNPGHLLDNLSAGQGVLPNAELRQRMVDLIGLTGRPPWT